MRLAPASQTIEGYIVASMIPMWDKKLGYKVDIKSTYHGNIMEMHWKRSIGNMDSTRNYNGNMVSLGIS